MTGISLKYSGKIVVTIQALGPVQKGYSGDVVRCSADRIFPVLILKHM